MNKKLISIVFPSRGRLDLLERLFTSIRKTTNKLDMIEIISICDIDDIETLTFFNKMSSEDLDFKFICRKRNKLLDLPNDYYSPALKLISDSYFSWIIGNDCEFISQSWDKILEQLIQNNELNYNINNDIKYYYLSISDGTHLSKDGPISWNSSCCFPIVSTNYVKFFNEIVPKEIPTWGGDVVLWNLANRLYKFEIIDLTKYIEIEHHTYHKGTYNLDENYQRMSSRGHGLNIEHLTNLIYEKKLKLISNG
jgi:hypothetical protein